MLCLISVKPGREVAGLAGGGIGAGAELPRAGLGIAREPGAA